MTTVGYGAVRQHRAHRSAACTHASGTAAAPPRIKERCPIRGPVRPGATITEHGLLSECGRPPASPPGAANVDPAGLGGWERAACRCASEEDPPRPSATDRGSLRRRAGVPAPCSKSNGHGVPRVPRTLLTVPEPLPVPFPGAPGLVGWAGAVLLGDATATLRPCMQGWEPRASSAIGWTGALARAHVHALLSLRAHAHLSCCPSRYYYYSASGLLQRSASMHAACGNKALYPQSMECGCCACR